MDERELRLKEEIALAGVRLSELGLVARTWGNISARLSDREMLIKPSGKDYHAIQPEHIVKVGIQDLSYDKQGLKPSSEKGVHAEIYKLVPEANYIIHTHQFFASAVCAECKDIQIEACSGKTATVPCAAYAEPGSPQLWENVARALKEYPGADMLLMARHGAIVFADTMEGCFQKALALEEGCRKLFLSRVPKAKALPSILNADPTGMETLCRDLDVTPLKYLDDYAMMVPLDYVLDDEEAFHMVSEKNAAASLYVRDASPIDDEAAMQQHLSYVNSYSKLK